VTFKREPPKTSLEELLKDVRPENLHGEWETGPAVGAEVWWDDYEHGADQPHVRLDR
jgi:hypothetical protein